MPYSFLKLAEDVLKDASHPLTYQKIWAQGKERKLADKLNTEGATPWATLGARLSTDILHNPNSRFVRVGARPQRYFLRSRQDEITEVDEFPESPVIEKTTYSEKDLHPLLAYLVSTNPNFFGEKEIYSKTIAHQRTRKAHAIKEWLHPDMVGVYFPFGDLGTSVIKLGQLLNSDSVQVFSFELKKAINKSNYREYFFQAVSNSSWAHEGYLVAAEISDDDELRRELGRLTSAFGIGIIHLKINDIQSSRVLFDARTRGKLDWDTVDKLGKVNKDFNSFVERLNTDISAGQVHKSEYDPIIDDPTKYIREKLKVKTVE